MYRPLSCIHSRNASPSANWQQSIRLARDSLERPGSFKQRLPLVDAAFTAIEETIPRAIHWDRSHQRGLWMAAHVVLEKLYQRAPTEASVPSSLALRALRVWHGVETCPKNIKGSISGPSWDLALKACRFIFPSVDSGLNTPERSVLLEIGTQMDLECQNVPKGESGTERNRSEIESGENISSDAKVVFFPVKSVEELHRERDILNRYIFYTQGSVFTLLRLLQIDFELHTQASLHKDITIKPSWEKTLRHANRVFSRCDQFTPSHTQDLIRRTMLRFIARWVPPPMGTAFVNQHVFGHCANKDASPETSGTFPLTSRKASTLLALSIVSVGGNFPLLTRLLAKVQPFPSPLELSTVLLESYLVQSHAPSQRESKLEREKLFKKFSKTYSLSASQQTTDMAAKRGHQAESTDSHLQELNKALHKILQAESTQFLRLSSLFINSSVKDPTLHGKEMHIPLRTCSLPDEPCASREDFVKRSLNRLLTGVLESSGRNESVDTTKHAIDIRMNDDMSVPQYSTSVAELQDSCTLPSTVIVHTRSEAETPRRRKRGNDALALMVDSLKLSPSTISHSNVVKTLAFLRGERRSKPSAGVRSLRRRRMANETIVSCASWRAILEICPYLRTDHPDIRTELFLSFLARLVQVASDSRCGSLHRRGAESAHGHNDRDPSFWQVALRHIRMSDLESHRLAPLVLQMIMFHPRAWEFALNAYCVATAHGALCDGKRRKRILTEVDFMHALSRVSSNQFGKKAGLPVILRALFSVGQLTNDMFYKSHTSMNGSTCMAALKRLKPNWALHPSHSVDSYVDTLRCAFFGDFDFARGGLCSPWELALGLLQTRPNTVLRHDELGRFALLALFHSSREPSRTTGKLSYAARIQSSLEEASVHCVTASDGDSPALVLCNAIDSINEALTPRYQPKVEKIAHRSFYNETNTNFHMVLLIRVAVFVTTHMLSLSFPSLKVGILQSFRHAQSVCSIEMRCSMALHMIENIIEEPKAHSFLRLLVAMLMASPSEFNLALAKFLLNVQAACEGAENSALYPAFGQRFRFREEVFNRRTLLARQAGHADHTETSRKSALPSHVDILPDCPELLLQHRRETLSESARLSTDLNVLLCDTSFAVVVCPPRSPQVDFMARALNDINRVQKGTLDIDSDDREWIPVNLQTLTASLEENDIETASGQSLVLFHADTRGLSSFSPVVRDLCARTSHPPPATISFPDFVTPIQYRYIVFTKVFRKIAGHDELHSCWEIDLDNRRILRSSCNLSSLRFLSTEYSLYSVFAQVIGRRQQRSSVSHGGTLEEEKLMVEVYARQVLVDCDIKTLRDIIGLGEDSPSECTKGFSRSRPFGKEKECDSFAMVELRLGECIIETTLPNDMESYARQQFGFETVGEMETVHDVRLQLSS